MENTIRDLIKEINLYIYKQIINGNFKLLYEENKRDGFECKIEIEGLIFNMNIFNIGGIYLHEESNYIFNMNNLSGEKSFDRKSISKILKTRNIKVKIEDLELEKFRLTKEIKKIEGKIKSIDNQTKSLRRNE